MTAGISDLGALRERANVAGRAAGIEQFRADFKLVWQTERAHGRLTEAEHAEAYVEASTYVRERMHDTEWLRNTAADYARMADAIRRDLERAERIRAKVRAERHKQRKAA